MGGSVDTVDYFQSAAAEDDVSRPLALLKDLDKKTAQDSLATIPDILSFVKHDAHVVVRQSIATGTRLFRVVVEKMALQLKSDKTERGLEEMWDCMFKFKDAMYDILTTEPGPVGIKMLAVKFLETYLLLFASDANNIKLPLTEGNEKTVSMSWFAEENPLLNPSLLASEANKTLAFLFDILQSANNLHGSLIIVLINCLTAIARNMPVHCSCILSALLDLDSNLETFKRGHATSIRYTLRTSLLRFLNCTQPLVIESQDRLLKALRAMYAGDTTEQIVRRLDKMSKSAGRTSRDIRLNKDDSSSGQIFPLGGVVWKLPVSEVNDYPTVAAAMLAKTTISTTNTMSSLPDERDSHFMQEDDDVNQFYLGSSLEGDNLTDVEKIMTTIRTLMSEGERATQSLDILLSNIHADLMADIVIDNMKHLSKYQSPTFGTYVDLPMNLQRSTSSSTPDVRVAGSMAVPVQYSAFPSQPGITTANSNNVTESNRDEGNCSARVSSLTG